MDDIQGILCSSYNEYLISFNEQYRGKKFKHENKFVLMVNNKIDYLKSFDTYGELTRFIDEMIDNNFKAC